MSAPAFELPFTGALTLRPQGDYPLQRSALIVATALLIVEQYSAVTNVVNGYRFTLRHSFTSLSESAKPPPHNVPGEIVAWLRSEEFLFCLSAGRSG